ncbi:MAG TPA: SMP-30/gluconolactonase/LRE family protein [Candidatus Limnocylindrales bacterium]|nr:SMP-30/gluconolactonase/LRE family protein [Candidatus Limnocylindrales bacterium]
MSKPQRRFLFLTFFVGGVLLLILLFVLLSFNSLNSAARTQGQALVPEVSVRPFASLPDNDAFPPAVVAAPNGAIYTGSFASGTVWAISPDGAQVTEVPGTRQGIGAVWALAFLPDGSLLVLDVRDTDPRSAGGRVVIVRDGAVSEYATIPDDRGFVSPNDMVTTPNGTLYVADGGRNEVWRFTAGPDSAQAGHVWWTPPTPVDAAMPRAFITGIAYDPLREALIITDPETNTIYRAAQADGATEVLYQHGAREYPPGFDGATIAPDGTLYVAALGQNGIARVENYELAYIAGLFRGASDVESDASGRLFVPNFDQSALVVPLVAPQLPFEIDVIEINDLPTPLAEATSAP